ncbi:hypothetical protein CPB84DRAFT_1838726 [Gymnopilus junonius]|uniref:Peptidase S9 prolyl oligopeptidase catalytic domain-containing protein n=1 Tax=Gymnopilus junonius TaxID=109634 RepID=A0A9P5TFY3_GYMJU|nr:hypothetical protein CPB84DRAFT_1838726 [Gymnopilus junonius]
MSAATHMQAYLGPDDAWKVQVGASWDVLGPFPIHAREQHFLSPAFPLNLSLSTDYTQTWPSSYADAGFVTWTKATSTPDGHLEISFPHIRWKQLRATEGWAALQHHAILRTTVTLYPPANRAVDNPPQLLVDLRRASYFALRPQVEAMSTFIPEWFAGNIYDLERALPHVVDLPSVPSPDKPTNYDLFVSGDYEIRLFGDPLVQHSDVPIQKIGLAIQIQDIVDPLVHKSSQDVICDFLGIELGLLKMITIAPSQTRIVPITIEQNAPYFGESIALDMTFTSDDGFHVISVSVPVNQHQLKLVERQFFIATFFFADALPSPFIIIPPANAEKDRKTPTILALHGAGVDILKHDFWVRSLPYNQVGWIVVPTGRTSWGLDWHGPSADDAWSSLEALAAIVSRRRPNFPESWQVPSTSQVVVVGHSNGGQGTWYLASRYPDRVLAAVPASAYVKSQSYIPLTLSRGGHFIDPALRAILDAAQTPDDNDLHLSNLIDMPILAIHGGDDENVPTWHTREATAALKAWYPSANITFREDPGEGHWYSHVLQNPAVQNFLDDVVSSSRKSDASDAFTLTVTIPGESGSLKGWKINKLMIPGRLARLHVRKVKDNKFEVEPSNVHTFTVPVQNGTYEIFVDDQLISIPSTETPMHIHRVSPEQWEARALSSAARQSPGRMQAILSSPGPIIVITAGRNRKDTSAALRLCHILHVYHRLDAEIITEDTALQWNKLESWPSGNIIFIGAPSSPFAKEVLHSKETAIHLTDSVPTVGNRKFNKAGQALLFLHPHLRNQSDSFMMFILYNDKSSLERAVRLFPFRTGIAVPEWLVTGDKMDVFGAGGIQAAGVWDSTWGLSEAMSWFYH